MPGVGSIGQSSVNMTKTDTVNERPRTKHQFNGLPKI